MTQEILDMIQSSDEEIIRLGVSIANERGYSMDEIVSHMNDLNKYYEIKMEGHELYLVNKFISEHIRIINSVMDTDVFGVKAKLILNNPL